MSQLLCLNNIRLFLSVCKSSQSFALDESDLFDEHMLYDLTDLACVIRTLSLISRSKLATTAGFRLSNDLSKDNKENNVSSSSSTSSLSSLNKQASPKAQLSPAEHTNDDIYYNIVPTELESPEQYYTDESFLFSGILQLDQQAQNDNSVYQTIVQSPSSHQHQPLKRDFVIREILNTEENFLDGLNTLNNDFLAPLSKILK